MAFPASCAVGFHDPATGCRADLDSHASEQVLIVGGSLIGLSTSLFLSWHGIASLLVERCTPNGLH
ncbi:MAG: FAD-dependent monooxygenase [Ktedonobacteraceae bacterium]